MHRLLALLTVVSFAAACGGGAPSSDVSPSTAAAGIDGTSSGTSGSTEPSGSATTATTLPTADPSLSAAGLLDVDGYAAALGEPVTVVEDDGGFPGLEGGHRSAARVATAGGLLFDVVLLSAASEPDAVAAYQRLAGGAPGPPLAGVGDEAAVLGDLLVVRRAAQLLTVKLDENTVPPELLGDDPKLAFETLGARVALLAAPLAAALSGDAAPEPVLALPPGTLDPCLLGGSTAAIVEDALDTTGVTATYGAPTVGAGVTCTLEGAGLLTPVQVTIVTDEQLQASAQPTTAAGQFAADVASAEANGTGTAAGTNTLVVAGGEYNEQLVPDPGAFLLEVDFPTLTRVPCMPRNGFEELRDLRRQLHERAVQYRQAQIDSPTSDDVDDGSAVDDGSDVDDFPDPESGPLAIPDCP